MAHVKKFSKAACGHMFKHYERARDDQGEYIKFGNQDIDAARTGQNYNLAPLHENGQGAFVRQRCSEVKCLNRKDVNIMCSWIVTAPASIAGSGHEKQFFEETYQFLSERYGKDNIVSAHVHMDEVTSHMHFAFVPVIVDKKKGHLKVSAKEAVNRADLLNFHTDLDRHVSAAMGERYGGDILNEATKDGNRSIEELKRQTAAERLAEASQKASETLQKAAGRVKHLQAEEKALQGQIKATKGVIQTVSEIESIGKGTLTGKVSMTKAEADALKEQAAAYYSASSRASKAEETAARLRDRYADLEREAPDLRQRVYKLTNQRDKAVREKDSIMAVIESKPELAEAFNAQVKAMQAAELEQKRQRRRGLDMGMSR